MRRRQLAPIRNVVHGVRVAKVANPEEGLLPPAQRRKVLRRGECPTIDDSALAQVGDVAGLVVHDRRAGGRVLTDPVRKCAVRGRALIGNRRGAEEGGAVAGEQGDQNGISQASGPARVAPWRPRTVATVPRRGWPRSTS